MKKREIEVNKLTYQDIAYNIIKEDKEPKSTLDLFKEICILLDLDQKKYQDVVGEFYTSLNLDKRFHLLENGNWDLKEKYAVKIIIDEDDFDELESIDLIDDYDIDDDDEENPEEDEEVEEEIVEEDDDILEEEEEISEVEDLTIIDEEELESDDVI